MLTELQFTDARRSLTDLLDGVWHRSLPAIIKRRQREEVLLVRRDLQQDILRTYPFKLEVLHEDDGSITLVLDKLELVVNAPTLDQAVKELVREITLYAEDYRDRIQLFLNAPNRRNHFPYVLRVWLCDNDEEIQALLEF
jgi:hypothetical protein